MKSYYPRIELELRQTHHGSRRNEVEDLKVDFHPRNIQNRTCQMLELFLNREKKFTEILAKTLNRPTSGIYCTAIRNFVRHTAAGRSSKNKNSFIKFRCVEPYNLAKTSRKKNYLAPKIGMNKTRVLYHIRKRPLIPMGPKKWFYKKHLKGGSRAPQGLRRHETPSPRLCLEIWHENSFRG